MFRNYLLTALRNLKRQKLYSAINIFGLSVGLTIFILAVTFFSFHLSFDNFHEGSDRIYVISSEHNTGNGVVQKALFTHLPLANLMQKNFPEVESATVFRVHFRDIFRYEKIVSYENNVVFTEPNFFKTFTYPIIDGDKKNPLSQPHSVVLNESTAKKYFGNENPIGKMLEVSFSATPLKVTAVLKDCPLNSSMPFNVLVSLPENYQIDWRAAGGIYTFVKLKSGVDANELEAKFPAFVDEFVPLQKESKVSLTLFPMKDIHLKSMGMGSGFNVTPLFQFYLIVGIAIALLIIVVINFMILSTSRFSNRAKEVGVRKVIGANKTQLIYQYIGESVLLSLLALILTFLMFELIRPAFIAMIGETDLIFWQNPRILLLTISVTLAVGIVSGIYPAFFLSSFNPSHILKDQYSSRKGGVKFRKILVLFQFALAFVMIAFTLTGMKQLDMLAKVDLGYSRKNVITIPVNNSIDTKFDVLERELKQNSNIDIVASAQVLPFAWGRQDKIRPEGANKEETESIYSYPCGYNFIEAIDIKIVKGRSFSRDFHDENSMIITEETARHYGWDDPIGKVMIFNERGEARKTIIGVAKDFHFPHVFTKKAPAVLFFLPDQPFYIYIKTVTKPDYTTIDYIRKVWNRIVPELPFEYSILDYAFEENLRTTTKSLEIFKYIAVISVFIACLGLFALSSYTAERRTKEIGVRKVLGASVRKITGMLLSEFLVLVIIANIIALPIAYYLSNFLITVGWIYKTDLSAYLFLTAAGVSIISALMAIGIQSVKAATANPVESLRYE
ncbi:MAG: ABC transporter permease [Calditrichaceae bacterium]